MQQPEVTPAQLLHEFEFLEQRQNNTHLSCCHGVRTLLYGCERNGRLNRAQRFQSLIHRENIVELRMLTAEEELLRASILELIKQTARRRFTITTGASCLLVVRFERTRHLVMNYKT